MNEDERFVAWPGGQFAVCIAGTYNGWAMFKHPDGQWVTQRRATNEEIVWALRARLSTVTAVLDGTMSANRTLHDERDARERERDAARTVVEIAIEGLDPMTYHERADWQRRLAAARKEAGL
jgi:hypothetical protein